MEIDRHLNTVTSLKYKTYRGRYISAMSDLRIDGRIPLTVRQIAEKRIEANVSKDDALVEGWFLNYFTTSDAVACCGDELKLIPNCELLVNIDSGTKLKKGAIALTKKQYNDLDGETFQFSEINMGKWLTKKEVKEHPVWQFELGDILEPYADLVFTEGKKQFDFSKAMKVSFPNNEKYLVRAVSLGTLPYQSSLNSVPYGNLNKKLSGPLVGRLE